jgi:hypothetical protein
MKPQIIAWFETKYNEAMPNFRDSGDVGLTFWGVARKILRK